MVFKRVESKSLLGKCWRLVEVPLEFIRNYTCPMSEYADWDRTRASILPFTTLWGFFFLWGKFMEDDYMLYVEICLFSMIPLLAFSIYIRFCTKVSEPPKNIMFVYALISFIMSITWISFTSDIVVDLLDMLGKILDVPKPVLGLTLLAWGNCLGDMNADVAMTKKGFGEMAITGCMAGPIFNILVGIGASTMKGLLDKESI